MHKKVIISDWLPITLKLHNWFLRYSEWLDTYLCFNCKPEVDILLFNRKLTYLKDNFNFLMVLRKCFSIMHYIKLFFQMYSLKLMPKDKSVQY